MNKAIKIAACVALMGFGFKLACSGEGGKGEVQKAKGRIWLTKMPDDTGSEPVEILIFVEDQDAVEKDLVQVGVHMEVSRWRQHMDYFKWEDRGGSKVDMVFPYDDETQSAFMEVWKCGPTESEIEGFGYCMRIKESRFSKPQRYYSCDGCEVDNLDDLAHPQGVAKELWNQWLLIRTAEDFAGVKF